MGVHSMTWSSAVLRAAMTLLRQGSGIGKGSISLHPGGHAHGPQPGALEASIGAERFDELADLLRRLAHALEDTDG